MKNNFEIILAIDTKIQKLTTLEVSDIRDILIFHECEPMAAAERISELLGVDYSAIFELL